MVKICIEVTRYNEVLFILLTTFFLISVFRSSLVGSRLRRSDSQGVSCT